MLQLWNWEGHSWRPHLPGPAEGTWKAAPGFLCKAEESGFPAQGSSPKVQRAHSCQAPVPLSHRSGPRVPCGGRGKAGPPQGQTGRRRAGRKSTKDMRKREQRHSWLYRQALHHTLAPAVSPDTPPSLLQRPSHRPDSQGLGNPWTPQH